MSANSENRDSQSAGGNTNPPAQKQANQLKKWFFTFNNFDERDIEILKEKFDTICEKYVFQHEKGEEGTDHLQGVISLKKRMRWSEFGLTNKIHWEKCISFDDAVKYCSKEDTRVSGPWYKGIVIRKPVNLKLINPDRPYQRFILDIIAGEPDDRTIYWFYETKGGVGKSSFSKYLLAKFNCLFIDEGKKTDIMNSVLNWENEVELVVLDVPRSNANKISYKAIESVKNGVVYSPKYEGGQRLFNSPHIIIFSNSYPDTAKLSADRWKIYYIKEDFNISEESIDCESYF